MSVHDLIVDELFGQKSLAALIYLVDKIGTKWTIGYVGKKLVNIRPGFCENGDEE